MIPYSEFLARLAHGERVAGTPRAPLHILAGDRDAPPPATIAHAVHVRHVHFEGPVRFDETRFAGSVRLERCTFPAGLHAADARIDGTFSLAGSRLADPITRRIDLRRIEVVRVIDLSGISCRATVSLENARLGDDVRLDGVRIARAPRHAIAARGAASPPIDDDLDDTVLCLEGAQVAGHVYLVARAGRRPVLGGALDLRARIGGSVAIDGACLGRAVAGVALEARGLELQGSLFVHDSTLRGGAAVQGTIRRDLQLLGTRIVAAPGARALDCERLRVDGSLNLVGGCRVTGGLVLRARIGGQLACSDLDVEVAAGKVALDLQRAHIAHGLFLRDGCRFGGPVTGGGVEVGGNLECHATTFGDRALTEGTEALALDHARIAGSVHLGAGNQVHGNVSFVALHATNVWLGARVAGRVLLNGAQLRGLLSLSGLEARGAWLDSARVGGDLELMGTRLGDDRPDAGDASGHAAGDTSGGESAAASGAATGAQVEARTSLLARHLRVQGDVYGHALRLVRATATPVGFEDFARAHVAGDVTLLGSDIDGFLNLDGITIDGSLNLFGTRIRGDLRLQGARIAGSAPVVGPRGGPAIEGALDAERAHMRQLILSLDEPMTTEPAGARSTVARVALGEARVDALEVRGTFDAARHDVDVDGLAFGGVEVAGLAVPRPAPRTSWRDAMRIALWLALVGLAALLLPDTRWRLALGVWALLVATVAIAQRRPTGQAGHARLLAFLAGVRFSRGFYLDVERQLRQRGEDAAADEVFLSRRKREAQVAWQASARLAGLPRRMWAELLDLGIGYGVRVSRAAHLWTLLWFVATGLFARPESVERPLGFGARPADEAPAPVPNPWSDEGGMPDAWSTTDGFWVASRLQLPFIALPAASDWAPSSRPVPHLGISYENLATVLVLVNAVLLPLLLAGATGILKKTE